MQMKKNVGLIVVLLVTLWFFGPFFYSDKNEKGNLFVFGKTNSKETDSEIVNTDHVYLKEMLGDSYVADVDYVEMSRPGFVAIVNNDYKIIGASKFIDRGVSRNLSIILTETLKRGDYYNVSIYQDDGDRAFSQKKDNLYLDGEYNVAFVGGFLVK